MKICAIDSSGLTAGIAVADEDIITAEYNITHNVTHSQTLLPMIEDVFRRIEISADEIDAYAVAVGPGSFTGLRIGIATVKGLMFESSKPVVAVPTLEALAYNAYGASGIVCPIMDARREQVYTGIYSFDRNGQKGLKVIKGQTAEAFEELAEQLNALGEHVTFIGDGIPVFKERMPELLKCGYTLAPAHMNRQSAASVAALAMVYLNGTDLGLEGEVTNAMDLKPVYLRVSQAERERAERESGDEK